MPGFDTLRGMAYIKQLPSGMFRAQVRRKGYPTISVTRTTEQECRDAAIRIEASIIDGKLDEEIRIGSIPVFRDELRSYIDAREKKFAGTSKASDAKRLEKFVDCKFANKRVHEVTFADIEEWTEERAQSVSGSTINRELNLLSPFFTDQIRKHRDTVAITNPVKLTERPENNPSRTRRVDEVFWPGCDNPIDELTVILEFSGSPDLPALVQLAQETAMRRGELVHTTPAAVKVFEEGYGTLHIPDTKTGEPRTIPLSAKAVELLKPLLAVTKKRERIFTSEAHSYSTAMRRARKRARTAYEQECLVHGIEADPDAFIDLRIHDQRHEGTSRLYEDHDLTDIEAASITGHKDPRMLKRYANLRAEKLAAKLHNRGKSKETSAQLEKLKLLRALYNEGDITEEVFFKRLDALTAE